MLVPVAERARLSGRLKPRCLGARGDNVPETPRHDQSTPDKNVALPAGSDILVRIGRGSRIADR
jgi:hypothetical protein